MAIRSASQYQSFRRRAGSPGSQSNYAASLIKKQNSAEDDYWDNQYDIGNITAEQYLTVLRGRETSRTYYTPLQLQNLKQKIVSVGEDFTDSEVEKMYKEGKIDTTGYTQYFKERLDTMTPDNKAYNTLSVKVKGLEDKSQREARAAYRLEQMVKISKEQGDTSKSHEAKAKLYQELEDQARLDGDTAQADQLLIQKNNAKEAARKANINDYLTETRGTSITKYGEVAQQAGTAPTSAGSAPLRSQGGSGVTSGVTKETATTTPKTSSFPTSGGSSKKVLSAMNRINDLETNKAELEYKISRYENAINQATGDQKTSLINTYNSYLNDYAQNTSSLADAQQSLADAQQAAVVEAANKYASDTSTSYKKDQKDLQAAFVAGQMDKEEYLAAAKTLFDSKMKFLDETAQGYDSLGEPDKAEKYRGAIETETPKYEALQYILDNKESFQPIRVDKNGKATGLFGDSVKAGDIDLVDISRLKDAGGFEDNYAKIGGVYHRVYAPKVVDEDGNAYGGSDENGEGMYLNMANSKEYAKIADTLYIYGKGGKKEPVKYAKVIDPKTKQPKVQYISNKKGEDGLTVTERLEKTEKMTGAKVLTKNKDGVPIINTVDPKGSQTVKDKFFAFINKGSSGDYNAQRQGEKKAPVDLDPTSKTFLQPKKEEIESITPALPTLQTAVKKAGERSSLLSSIVKPVYADEEVQKPQPTIGPKVSPEAEFQALIVDALRKEGILNEKTLAYAMATAKLETAGSFRPVREGYYNDDKYGYAPGFTGKSEARKRGYGGGDNYYGRGYIQLTHQNNYDAMGKRIGVPDLAKNPDKALDPKIAAKIMAAFMKDRGVSDAATKGDFVGARKGVNGTDRAVEIADIANDYVKGSQEYIKKVSLQSSMASKPVKAPKQVAAPKEQGILGRTFDAVSNVIAPPVSGAELRSTQRAVASSVRSTPSSSNASSVKTNGPVYIAPRQQSVAIPKQISTPLKANATSAKTGQPVSIPKPTAPQASTALPKASVAPKQISTPAPAPKPAPKKEEPKQNIVQKAVSSVKNVLSSFLKKK